LKNSPGWRSDKAYPAGERLEHIPIVKPMMATAATVLPIGGYKPAGSTFESLLVGYYQGRQLRFAGKVRAGLTPHLRREILTRIAPLRVERCPFANLPSTTRGHWGEGVTATEMPTLHWVKPTQVLKVSFTEWTREGNFRHAAFVGMRDDKVALEVRRET